MTATIPSPAPTGAAAVLAHHDDLLDVFTCVTQDCVLAGLTPLSVNLAAYVPGFLHASVQLSDVDSVEVLAAAWRLHPDDGKTGNYTRAGSLDVDGRTVTVSAYSGRPTLPRYPQGYAPTAVQS